MFKGDRLEEDLMFMGESIKIDMKLPPSPSFPFLILAFAVVKDFLDVISLGFLGVFTTIVFGLIIGIWVAQKVGIIRKLLFKKFIIRFLVFFVVGFFPLISMLPEATILVFLTFSNEVKIVNGIYGVMEKAVGGVLKI